MGLRLVRAVFRVLYRLLYYELAWTYDLVSWGVSLGQWRAWQRSALPYLRGRQILEIAHGTGDLLLDLTALGFEPVGLDLSPVMGRLAQRKLRRHNVARPLVRARVQALPFAAASFPSLLSTFPAEFIVEPPALAEFFRVLQPGGVLVCVPSAQFKGSRLADRWTAFLFQRRGVARQDASAWLAPLTERFAAAGFAARVERVELPRSAALVIVGERTSAASDKAQGTKFETLTP
jgi:ubiquinone/menaquinone biosynthesis C-methylase UbiE